MDSFGFLVRSHIQSESQGSARAGTPTLPPGLPLPHSHPASALFHSPLNPSSPTSSVSVLPPGLNIPLSRLGTPSQSLQDPAFRAASPDPKDTPEIAPPSHRTKNVSEISLGSPVPKSASKARSQPKDDMTIAAEKKSGKKAEGSTENKGSLKGKPMKLDLPLGTSHTAEVSPSKVDLSHPASSGPAPAPPSAIGSRPNTPLTAASRLSDSSAPRQPRVLRVVDTPKAETPPPVSATPSHSSQPIVTKTRSRRPSVSSISRPDTPGDFGSEADLYTSASVSRANSPPASSRIGSAPVRSMTKSQVKKERRQKAKEAEAKKHEEASALAAEPVQAPIVGRKRKTKKAPTSQTETPSPAPENANEAAKLAAPSGNDSSDKLDQKPESKKSKPKEKAKEQKASPVEVKETPPPKIEPWRSNNTIEQLIKDSAASGIPIKELFAERTLPLPTLLAELHKSGKLDLNTHPLFNPPNLSQRVDMKCNANDYDILKHPFELTEEHRKALLRGEPVRLNADSSLLKYRCLITPRGCVLRHLSREEEDRYLELEKNSGPESDRFRDYPAELVTEPDITNRSGGLDALFATPENFNIRWVDATSAGLTSTSPTAGLSVSESSAITSPPAPPNVLSAMEADSTRSHNWAIANTAELVNATATSVRSFAAATAKHMLGAAGVVVGTLPDLDDVVGMTDEELRTFTVKSQKELETSRKEFDSIDKKLNALVKRNKKLAQQALASN